MTEYVRQFFGSIRNFWSGGSTDTRTGPLPAQSSYFPATARRSHFHNNHLPHHSYFNNNNNFSLFPRKRKRSPDLDDDPSMFRTKATEKEAYKQMVERMQNGGFHSNGRGSSSYATSKIPRILPIHMNGVSHDKVSQPPPPLLFPTKTSVSASTYYTSQSSAVPVAIKPLDRPALVKSRQSHAYVKSVFDSLDNSIDGVSGVQEAHKTTVSTVDSMKRLNTRSAPTPGFGSSSRTNLPTVTNLLPQTRSTDRQASLYSTRPPWMMRSTNSRHTPCFGTPEVINLSNDEDVEIISPIPQIFTSTPSGQQQRTPAALSIAHLRRDSSGSVTGTSQSDNKRVETPDTVSDDIEDDPDIQVLSESIISPRNNQYQVNSLELETRQSIYRQKTWLTNSGSEYRESQKHRKEQIGLERKKMEILKHESDLPNDIEERIRKNLTITDIIVLEPEDVPLTLPPITPEMRKIVNHSVTGREGEVIVTAFNIPITRGDLRTLAPCKWLNDNVINTYMEMIALRSKEGKFPKVHVFSTFFYPKYLKEGYSNVLKRWTRKVDIFSMDLVIFPIHLGIHWCLAVADLRKKSIRFYDSLLGQQTRCLEALFAYLSSEMKERKKMVLNRSEWSMELMKDIPTQENGSDCGVFACKFAEYLSRDAKLTFKQKDMDYYRDRMVYEIVKQDLLYP